MLYFAACLILILKASTETGSKTDKQVDDALVKGVEDTLGECTAIVDAVQGFVHVFEIDDNRRRSVHLGVKTKLKTCAAIVDAVDVFREDYRPWSRGLIDLRLNEIAFIGKLLKEISKGMGETQYVASKDGDSSGQFHSACDNKGPTVVIVKTKTGAVFGGYTDVNWGGSAAYVSSSTSFLFRIRPAMTHHTVKKEKVGNAVYRNSGYGPSFGGGHDFYIASGALSNKNSYSNAGHSYTFPFYPSYQLPDGEKNFYVEDYIVLKAVAL